MIDRIKSEQLADLGFVIISEGKAEHSKYTTWRLRCHKCGDWVRQLTYGKDKVKLCNRCFRKL